MTAKLWSQDSGAVGFSSKVNTWSTPQDFFDKLDAEFKFTLDPCASHDDAKCYKYYTEEEDGLVQSWRGETVFLNPPYGRDIKKWIKKAYDEASGNCETTVVCLLPARTDTKYWHDYVMNAKEIRLVKGRLKFGDSKNSAPFPSAVVVFRSQYAGLVGVNPKLRSM
jgi:site-specific DNA-methyltransferase (adenine-specific)